MKRIIIPALAFTVVATGAACGSEDSADPPPPTTTSPTAADEEALRDLAEGWFETSRGIYLGEVDLDEASNFLAGGYLENFRRQASDFQSSGQAARADDRSSQEIRSVEFETGSRAIVVECVVDADAVVDGATGTTVNDQVAAITYRTIATRIDGEWRYSERENVDEQLGSTVCGAE